MVRRLDMGLKNVSKPEAVKYLLGRIAHARGGVPEGVVIIRLFIAGARLMQGAYLGGKKRPHIGAKPPDVPFAVEDDFIPDLVLHMARVLLFVSQERDKRCLYLKHD
jgi:hypothetical protein